MADLLNVYFTNLKFLTLGLCCLQLSRLQSSVAFRAARSLNFQEDMIGSVNMLLCGNQPDLDSPNMTLSLRPPGQTDNNESISNTGNSSGECRSKLIF